MVKHPQSRLGYAEDGHVVRLPVRRPIIDDKNKNSKFLKSHVTNKEQQRKKKNQRNHNPESGGIRGLRNKLLASADDLEDLRNYSKQGRIEDACTLVVKIACSCFGRCITDRTFQLMVRCLVAPSIEKRSALYYAAHAGHASIARTYLALVVLSLATRSQDNDIERSQTFASWMCEFGCIEFFGHREYDACILNALNESTKAVFKFETYSMKEIQNIVLRSPWREYLPEIPHAVAKKERKPRLQVEDEYDLDHFSPRLCSDRELAYHLEHFSARGCSDEELSPHDFHAYDDYLEYLCNRNHVLGYYDNGNHDEERVESTTIVSDLDGSMVQQLMLTDEVNKSDLAFPTIGVDAADQSWCDDWSEVHTTTISVTYHGDVNSGDGDEWSFISDVASVKSISSVPLSYSDALRFGRKGTMESIVENRLPSVRLCDESLGESGSIGNEGDDEDAYDAFFISDGIKDCRGGKAVFRFKGNQKVQRPRWR
ncbi:hypothetical protein MHU86_25828 [Fragilaria crotonensis]|nr:hypothetical protein MHU86_25828 [Fragilaria crotonensis]